MHHILVLCVCASFYVKTDGLESFVTRCHASDATCNKASAQQAVSVLAAGVPSLGLTPLDPLHIPLVKADQAGLKVQFRDTVVKGLRNCVILGLRRSGHRHTVELKCSVTLIGDYSIGGQLLILPVEGDGRYKIKIRDIIVKVQYEVGTRSAKGDLYWTLNSWKHTAEVQTGCEFQFQNLFHGNKQLSDSVHQFANGNWRDIFQEVAPPIVRAIVARIVEEVSKLFQSVPIKDLALD